MNAGVGGNWVDLWFESMGLGGSLPQPLVYSIALFCTFCLVILPSAAAISFFDRKLSADLQARIGPNRAGPGGLLQPLADVLKLLQKDTKREWSFREALWLAVYTMALYSTVAVLPLGSLALLVDTDMSAFIPFWAALVIGLGTMLLGLSQGTVPGWFGGIRIAAQTLSGSFPALIALLSAGVRIGSFRWSAIVAAQSDSILHWTIFSQPPFQGIAFLVFVMSGLVLLTLPPLDGGLSISDIHGGVVSHLNGRRYTLFRMGRFYGFFFWSVISVVLFLGGWNLPLGLGQALRDSGANRLLVAAELVVLLTKTLLLMMITVWVARVNPRGRVDQITDFSWKVLSPFSLIALVGASLWVGWGAWK